MQNAAELRAYDSKIADCLKRLAEARTDADRQHLVPDLEAELATLQGNRAALERRLAA